MYNSKLLYVGCGAHKLEGFIHVDISVYKLSKIYNLNEKKIDVICDITDQIPLKDKSMELIFSRFFDFVLCICRKSSLILKNYF